MVFINGIGLITPLGNSIEEVYASIKEEESALHEGCPFAEKAGYIQDLFDITDYSETKFHYLDPASAFTVGAVTSAFENAGYSITPDNEYETGLTLGSVWSCSSSMELFEQKLREKKPKFAPPFLFSNSFPNSPSTMVSIEHGIKGYNTVYSGSSNAGFMACITAWQTVLSGICKTVCAVGTDALSQTVVSANSDEELSEGAVCILMSSRKSENAVAITQCNFNLPENPDISVRENHIRIKGKEVLIGNGLALSLPLAIAIGTARITEDKNDSCVIGYHDRHTEGSILLTA